MNITIIKEKEGINLRLAWGGAWMEAREGLERGYLREAVEKKGREESDVILFQLKTNPKTSHAF